MYTTKNFKSKKELKAAVEAWNEYQNLPAIANPDAYKGQAIVPGPHAPRAVTYFQPGPFGGNEPRDGMVYLEGPHFPASHSWYAQATVKDGVIVKVK